MRSPRKLFIPMASFHFLFCCGAPPNSLLFLTMWHAFRQGFGVVLLGVLALISCKSAQPSGADETKKIATEKLGEEVDSFPNSTGKYMLFVQKPQPTASRALKFIVVESSTREVVETQTFIPGYVKWVTEYSLEVLSVPGTLKSNDDLSKHRKVITIRSPK